jgi:hypothetical protein
MSDSDATAQATETKPEQQKMPFDEDALIDKITAQRAAMEPKLVLPLAGAEPGEDEQPEPAEGPENEEPKAAEVEPEPKEAKKVEEAEGVDAEAYEHALTALRLDGVPQSVLEKLGRADLLAWGSKAAKRHTKTATELQQRTEKIRALEEAQTTKKPEPQKPTGDVDLDAALKPAIEALDELGTDAGAKLAQALKALQGRIDEKLGAVEQTNALFGSHLAEFVLESARSKLTERFPELADDAQFEKVQTKMIALAQSGAYADMSIRQSVPAALEDAAKIVLFDAASKRTSDAVSTQHRKRANGQMTPPSRAPEGKKLDRDAMEDRLIDLLSAGKRDEARKLALG